MSSLVKLINITKSYRTSASEQLVLKNIDFHLNSSEMLAIVGTSGSGKSTLMNIIGFLDKCSSGKYFFSGKDVSNLQDAELAGIRNQKIGFVFQSFFLLPRLSVLQNVMLPLVYRNSEKKFAKDKALSVLAKVGMENWAERKPNQLSGGQQQRVAIARALVSDPEVILADEPTGSLDSKTGQEVMDLFHDLNINEKRTLVLVTHDENISKQCQRIVRLKDGELV